MFDQGEGIPNTRRDQSSSCQGCEHGEMLLTSKSNCKDWRKTWLDLKVAYEKGHLEDFKSKFPAEQT